jgi:RimJ/RimL family protein N-acetyltransferase
MNALIETERLLLRELMPADDKAMFELDSDAEVHRYLGSKPIQSIEESQQVIQFIRDQYKTNGIGRWAVVDKQTQNFIGWAGLKFITEPINNHVNYYDLGYRFIRKYWGKGFAFESARAVLKFGFETMQLEEIYAMAELGNTASQNVLTKAGLQFVETFTWQAETMRWYKITNPKTSQ